MGFVVKNYKLNVLHPNLMILALKYIQNFIKTYQAQVGALMHTCALCTYLHIPPTPSPPPSLPPQKQNPV